jgi:hypothetical protein
MVKHKFTRGERVAVVPDRDNPNVPRGTYTVVRALPLAGSGSGPQYRVKHALDSHERVIDEAQLRAA